MLKLIVIYVFLSCRPDFVLCIFFVFMYSMHQNVCYWLYNFFRLNSKSSDAASKDSSTAAPSAVAPADTSKTVIKKLKQLEGYVGFANLPNQVYRSVNNAIISHNNPARCSFFSLFFQKSGEAGFRIYSDGGRGERSGQIYLDQLNVPDWCVLERVSRPLGSTQKDGQCRHVAGPPSRVRGQPRSHHCRHTRWKNCYTSSIAIIPSINFYHSWD